ncbi:hypothetical protein B0F90DRAFT_1556122, partial [Multifurca ochricompacta]
QLRTPSPSEAEVAFNELGPAARIATDSTKSSTPSISKPVMPPTAEAEALHALVTSIPPKTLHTYVLAHIHAAPPDTLPALASFFATLTPPPLLHCVRCHAYYTEVENSDRSCHMPHDDDSADVEWVGRSGRGDSEHETFYGCCGKTVEGEGDLGPPDGWCYEGMHTTDRKRARFRADSTLADDKLESCFQLNCRHIRSQLPSAKKISSSSRAKRPRLSLADGDMADDDGISQGEENTGVVEIPHDNTSPRGQRDKGKTRAK